MTNYIDFILKLLMSYGIVFLLTYYAIIILHRNELLKFQGYYIGILVAMITNLQIYSLGMFDYEGIPDGKFFLAGLVTFFWGLGPGLTVVLIVLFFKNIVYGVSLFPNLILFVASLTFFKCARVIIEKYKIKENLLTYIILSMISFAYILIIASFIFEQHVDYITAKQHYGAIFVVGALIVSALFVMVKHELNEIDLINTLRDQKKELLEQKIEIQALYEEMVASEETLKSNYDELKRYQEKVEFLAFHESQTGFSNKEKLYNQLREYQKSNSKVLILLAIKDRTKLNHTIGNTLFDMLHFTVGAEIQKYFEQYSNNELYSLGSGLFAILLIWDESEDQIDEVFDQFNREFIKNGLMNSMGLSISIEGGAVHLNRDLIEPEIWVEYAESAMLMSQHVSKSNKLVWFKNNYYEHLQAKSYLVTNLKKALAKEEFYVVYQPKFDHEGQIKSAEALVRWSNMEFGEITPYTFIPLAETNGVIGDIGEFVMASVCELIRTVEENNIECIPIAINASIIEILNPQYSLRVFETLREKGIKHDKIQIEVTESTISKSYEDVIRTLTELSDGEIEIHLDDFGTGYSSLSHIGIMPISVIKIDKKFIDKIELDKKYENLIEMMIEFSHRSGIQVVAEGVEHLNQLNWLKDRDCDFYQGYYFSKPIDAEDLIKWLKIR